MQLKEDPSSAIVPIATLVGMLIFFPLIGHFQSAPVPQAPLPTLKQELARLALPEGARPLRDPALVYRREYSSLSQGFSVPGQSDATLLAFYRTEFAAQGWRPAPSGNARQFCKDMLVGEFEGRDDGSGGWADFWLTIETGEREQRTCGDGKR